MSKKKPTAPIPLTGTVTITTDGRTTLAMKASHRGEDIEVSTGLSHCRPGDAYSEYEGARIALARLYGLDPFPQEDKPQEKGHWEKATKENCKVGPRVRVAREVSSFGTYKNGDTGVVGSWFTSNMANVKFDRELVSAHPACFLDELDVWIPDDQAQSEAQPEAQSDAQPEAQSEVKPQEAPIPEAPKPFTPSFQVGDIVRLSETDERFRLDCRGKVGKVRQVNGIAAGKAAFYKLEVYVSHDKRGPQYCTEWPDTPAPLELLFRDPQKDGEKA